MDNTYICRHQSWDLKIHETCFDLDASSRDQHPRFEWNISSAISYVKFHIVKGSLQVVSVSRHTTKSNPVLSPNFLLLFTPLELEFDRDDIVEALIESGGAEATGEVAEGDSREGGAGFRVLGIVNENLYTKGACLYQFFVWCSDGIVVFA